MANDRQVLALLSGKGGSGKTVIALSMGKSLVEAGYTVLLVDCDIATHGGSYFFEQELESVSGNVLALAQFAKNEAPQGQPLLTRAGFHFIPSTLDPASASELQPMLDDDIASSVYNRILNYAREYNVVIYDCQAGYSALVRAAADTAKRSLIVLEPDAVSSAALRVLYLQLGKALRPTTTWQIFNKLTEEERPIYEKVMGGTLFPSLPPVPFDWQVRAAFATREIPGVTERSSAFGLGVLRVMKTVFPSLSNRLQDLEQQTVGNWYTDIRRRLEALEERRRDLKFGLIERRRRQRIQRLRITTTLIAAGLTVLMFPVAAEIVGLKIFDFDWLKVVTPAVTALVVAATAIYYLSTMREVEAEFEQDRAQEAITSIENEIKRYTTLVATDPGLREFSRAGTEP